MYKRFCTLFGLIVLNTLSIKAQQSFGGSPYSRFGVGDLSPLTFVLQRGMGDIGIGYSEFNGLNLVNPAAMVKNRFTTYEFGGYASFTQMKNSTEQLNKQITNFSYGAIGFPLGKRFNAAAAIMPFSNGNYSISGISSTGSLNYSSYFSGTGGLNQAIVTGSYRANRRLSFGLRMHYVFGTISQNQYILFPDSINALNTYVADQVKTTQGIVAPTVYYRIPLKKEKWLNIGLVAELPFNMVSSRNLYAMRFRSFSSTGVPLVSDTIVNEVTSGQLTLPNKFGVGVSYEEDNHFVAAAEFKMQDWSSYRSFGYSDSLQNSYTVNAGLQWLPNQNSTGRGFRYFSLIRYRLGFKFAQTYLQLRNTPIQESVVSMGMSFPLRKSFSLIHFAAELGMRGTTQNNLIQEQFVRFTLGFSLNDIWFIRSRYE